LLVKTRLQKPRPQTTTAERLLQKCVRAPGTQVALNFH
jgi:hypothetical protein